MDIYSTWRRLYVCANRGVPFSNRGDSIHDCFIVQAQAVNASLANGVSEDSSSGSGANPSELGDGLTLDGGIAQRLFQFQLTGDRHR